MKKVGGYVISFRYNTRTCMTRQTDGWTAHNVRHRRRRPQHCSAQMIELGLAIADRNQPEWAIQSQLIRLWFSIISLLNGTLQIQVCVINTMRGMETLTSRSRPYARWSRHQLTICPESERQRRRIWLQNRFHNYSRYELISETDVLGATSTIHVTSIDVFSCPWPWAVLEKLDIGLNPLRYIPWLCKTALWATGQNVQLMSSL